MIKTGNKLLLGAALMTSTLLADVTTILPYVATIKYSNDSAKSIKDSGTVGGVYFSHGNLDYLVELDYAKTDIKYKDGLYDNLKQDDITAAYSRYFESFFVKLGLHHTSTTDPTLGNGDTLIATLGGYTWDNADKYSYTIESYYSRYKNGFDELNVAKKITLFQLTPSVTVSKAIDINTRNNFTVKLNFITTNDYIQDSYFSYEVQDTLYYKSFFVNAKVYGGEMKTGIKDGGNTVYNTKDLLKNGYGLKLGYYITPSMILSAGYERNNYREYESTKDGSFDVGLLTFTYTF